LVNYYFYIKFIYTRQLLTSVLNLIVLALDYRMQNVCSQI